MSTNRNCWSVAGSALRGTLMQVKPSNIYPVSQPPHTTFNILIIKISHKIRKRIYFVLYICEKDIINYLIL